jgi:uncharacterized protein YbjT (DUF2867 family)
MRIAITGGTGFIGCHLSDRLLAEGHEVVLLARNSQSPCDKSAAGPTVVQSDLSDIGTLVQAFEGCEAIAHCAGINRELGLQTYERVHVEGTKRVVDAAKLAGVKRVVLMSFLRARPNCGSSYHESKWAAEEIVRDSGLHFTVIKAGVVYGLGDHMLDHLSRALYTFPIFATVGLKDKSVRPLAVADLVDVMRAALIDRRLKNQTIGLLGPEVIYLSEAVRRVAEVVGRHPLMVPMPIWCHQILARLFELTMKVPLASLAQVRILAEGVVEAATPVEPVPYDLVPTRRFTVEQIRGGLPQSGPFALGDLRWCS